jgi:hypothetical protein
MNADMKGIKDFLTGISTAGYTQPDLSPKDLKTAYELIQSIKDTYLTTAPTDDGTNRSYKVCDGHINYTTPAADSFRDFYNFIVDPGKQFTTCSCNGNTVTPCWCDSRTTCSCDCRTACSSVSSSCSCRARFIVCNCKTRCSCNARCGCNCDSRTGCTCNDRCECNVNTTFS